MHSRSIYYNAPPDFARLAEQFPDLSEFVQGRSVDFTNADAARAVTRALLSEDFNLDLELPSDKLCPPVPNRLNYIHWMEDLIFSTQSNEILEAEREVIGIDVGTGASIIYPALACRLHQTWQFLALEVDQTSLDIASRNIVANALQDRITLLRSDASDHRLFTQHEVINDLAFRATFTMCNPPFYDSVDDLKASSDLKADALNSANTGSHSELFTPGGDLQFATLLFRDSTNLKSNVKWFSTMLGRLSSVFEFVALLRRESISNYALTELKQGKTRRWVVAWSFQGWRPPASVGRACSSYALQSLLPYNTSMKCDTRSWDRGSLVIRFCEDSAIDWEWIRIKSSILIRIIDDTWSRQARRRLKMQANKGDHRTDGRKMYDMLVEIECVDQARVGIHWRYGNDHILWTSLSGKLKQLLR